MFYYLVYSSLLASCAGMGWSDPRANAEGDASAAELPSLTIGAVHAQAEEIDLDVRRDGIQDFKLKGSARVTIGDAQASGDRAALTLARNGSGVLRLEGNIRLVGNAIHASARSAEIYFTSARIGPANDDGDSGVLRSTSENGVNRPEPMQIRLTGLKQPGKPFDTATVGLSQQPK
jgi:hypothetical protein